MRIEKDPKVYLIARPSIVREEWSSFLQDMNLKWPTPVTERVRDAERLVEMAGRCCYMSFGNKAGSKSNWEYIRNLVGLDRGGIAHGSVTEHVNWTFLVRGAGRGFSHEQVRHRVGVAYSQLSTRYCDFEREEDAEGTWVPGFVLPPLAQLSEEVSDLGVELFERAREDYKRILELVERDLNNHEGFVEKLMKLPKRERKRTLRKAARGVARDFLPIATEAIMTITMNARTIWNTIVMRANENAEAVIREIYVQIARFMEQEMPALFNGIEYYEAWDGSTCVKMPREKL